MIVKLLTEHQLVFLSLKIGCRGSSESTLVKMSNCWKSHALAQSHMVESLTLCLLGNFACLSFFLYSADFFFNQLFLKILLGTSSECQTVWIQVRPDIFVGHELDPNCLKKRSAEDTSR